MPVARLTIQGRRIRVETSYDPEFVDDLKRIIPAPYREWNPTNKVWLVNVIYKRELIDVCRRHFNDVEFDEPQSTAIIPEHYRQLYMLPGAPRPVIDAVFRELARIHHPDVSDHPDSTERMKRINDAYDRIRQEVSA